MEANSTYEDLVNRGDELARRGLYGEAALLLESAAKLAPTQSDVAQLEHRAAQCFGGAGNEAARHKLALMASERWTEIASTATRESRTEFYWNALLCAVTARDKLQVGRATLVTDSLENVALDSRGSELERLIRKLPPVTQAQTEQVFWHAVGDAYFAKARREQDNDELLRRARQAYENADYPEGVRNVRQVLAERAFAEGVRIEEQASHADGLLRQERLFRQAGRAYNSYYWPEEAERCEGLAKQLAESADRLAKRVLVASLAGDVISAFLTEPKTRGGSLIEHLVGDSARLTKLEASEGWIVGQTYNLGWWSADLAAERLTDRIVARAGIPGDLAILRDLVRRAVVDIGDTSSYCPTPTMMPSSVVTTKWRQTLLAMLVTGVAGASLGLVSTEPELQTVMAAVLGAEIALAVNLVSAYLTRQRESEIGQLLKKYDKPKALLILHLLREPRTASQLAKTSHRTTTQTRRDLAKLERDGIVKKNPGGPRGAFVWTLADKYKNSG